MTHPARTTVCVVAYNSGAFLQDCLDALAAQTERAFACVIVDNASEDGSIEALRLPDDRFSIDRAGENLGFAAGNNRAAFAADTDFFVTLNPDTVAEPTWLSELIAAADRWPSAGAVGSTQVRLDDPAVLDGAGDMWSVFGVGWRALEGRSAASAPDEGEVFSVCAAAALYRTALFRALGGFDERFFCYCEDIDIGFRMRLTGAAVIQAPRAVVRHAGSGVTGRRSQFSTYHGHRNRIWTYVKNTPAGMMWWSLPGHLGVNLVFLITGTLRGRGAWLIAAYRDAVRGLPAVLRDRRTVQAESVDARRAGLWRTMVFSPITLARRGARTAPPDAPAEAAS